MPLAEGYELRIAKDEELEEICRLKSLCFIDKLNHWCLSVEEEVPKEVKSLRKKQPWALNQLAVVRETVSSRIVGACQVKFEGQKGDVSLPSTFQHKCKPKEAHIEFICVDATCRGKGIGQALMQWSDQFAVEKRNCTKISLHVSTKNRAKHLYERQGYQVVDVPDCFDIVISYVLLGHPGFYFMEKHLAAVPDEITVPR